MSFQHLSARFYLLKHLHFLGGFFLGPSLFKGMVGIIGLNSSHHAEEEGRKSGRCGPRWLLSFRQGRA